MSSHTSNPTIRIHDVEMDNSKFESVTSVLEQIPISTGCIIMSLLKYQRVLTEGSGAVVVTSGLILEGLRLQDATLR